MNDSNVKYAKALDALTLAPKNEADPMELCHLFDRMPEVYCRGRDDGAFAVLAVVWSRAASFEEGATEAVPTIWAWCALVVCRSVLVGEEAEEFLHATCSSNLETWVEDNAKAFAAAVVETDEPFGIFLRSYAKDDLPSAFEGSETAVEYLLRVCGR